jgi:hypothetical protein
MITSLRIFTVCGLLVGCMAPGALAAEPSAPHTLAAGYGDQPPFMPLPTETAPAVVPSTTAAPIPPPPHRGLHACLQLGGGFTFAAARIANYWPGTVGQAYGESASLGLDVGWPLTRRLLLFGKIMDSIVDASGGGLILSNGGFVNTWGAGIGVAYRPETIFVSGALLATRMTMGTRAYRASSQVGPGLEALVGREGPISARFGLGAALQVFVAAMGGGDGSLGISDAPVRADRWTEITTSILLRGTYN